MIKNIYFTKNPKFILLAGDKTLSSNISEKTYDDKTIENLSEDLKGNLILRVDVKVTQEKTIDERIIELHKNKDNVVYIVKLLDYNTKIETQPKREPKEELENIERPIKQTLAIKPDEVINLGNLPIYFLGIKLANRDVKGKLPKKDVDKYNEMLLSLKINLGKVDKLKELKNIIHETKEQYINKSDKRNKKSLINDFFEDKYNTLISRLQKLLDNYEKKNIKLNQENGTECNDNNIDFCKELTSCINVIERLDYYMHGRFLLELKKIKRQLESSNEKDNNETKIQKVDDER